jgi:hypothetical protein
MTRGADPQGWGAIFVRFRSEPQTAVTRVENPNRDAKRGIGKTKTKTSNKVEDDLGGSFGAGGDCLRDIRSGAVRRGRPGWIRVRNHSIQYTIV